MTPHNWKFSHWPDDLHEYSTLHGSKVVILGQSSNGKALACMEKLNDDYWCVLTLSPRDIIIPTRTATVYAIWDHEFPRQPNPFFDVTEKNAKDFVSSWGGYITHHVLTDEGEGDE